MEFSLNKEQRDIKEAAREFAQSEFDPDLALEFDREGRFPSEIWKKACELGFIGMHFPERYGGQGLGFLDYVLVIEEFCRQHSGVGMALGLSCFGAEMVLHFGSEDQKTEYLPPLSKGQSRSSFGAVEWNPRGSVDDIESIAQKTERGYNINGNKSFVINSTFPGLLVLFCKLKRAEYPNDLAAFVVEKNEAKLQPTMMAKTTGMRMVPIANLTLSDFEVSNRSIIGKEGQGRQQLVKISEIMRIEAAAMGTGIAQGAFDLALGYCKQREQFGRKIGAFEAIRDRLAEMATRIEISRLLTYKAASFLDDDKAVSGISYMAKMVSVETAFEVAKSALHCFGGYGYITENQIEHFYRDSCMVEFIGVPGDKEKKLIADGLIGKI
jgi:alkylation response protein AidB-like acyl-CoA dehydrogenase